mgnify:CR=1 FL=1
MICATNSLDPKENNDLKDSREKVSEGFHLTNTKLSTAVRAAATFDCATIAHTPQPFNAHIIPVMPEVMAEINDIFSCVLKFMSITSLTLSQPASDDNTRLRP